MVEHSAVNRRVVGSNPTRGADKASVKVWGFMVLNEILPIHIKISSS